MEMEHVKNACCLDSETDSLFEEAWGECSISVPQMQQLPSGELMARLMQLHQLAEATAKALLLAQPLSPADETALFDFFPSLLQLTAVPGAAACSAGSPFAAAASVVLAQRPDAGSAWSPVSLTYPTPPQQQRQPGAAACHFLLATPPSTSSMEAELQVFAQQVNTAVEQSSKEALEDALNQLSQHPSPTVAIQAVRRSIEGQEPPEALRSSLRSVLLRKPGPRGSLDCSGSFELGGDSLASTPLRLSTASL